jgi:hypothetical protein
MKKNYFLSVWLTLGLLMPFVLQAQISTFDDLQLDSTNAYWNGSDLSGGFQSGSAYFYNSYNADWGSWAGFAYTNMTDDTTAGWGNQYSAITASGVNGSSNYAVSYAGGGSSVKLTGDLAGTTLKGVFVTNSTYAALSMQEGDAYAKKFGGADGTDPDWFLLTIKGYAQGVYTDSVNFYLADFRSDDPKQDYILKSWAWVDLHGLGTVDSLTFELHSSDVGDYGMNTPAYFCMDNLNDITNGIEPISVSNKTLNWKVFPNPTSEFIHVQGVKDASIRVFDLNGREVYRTISPANAQKINLSAYPKGLYLIQVNKGQVLETKKVFKQ